MTFVNFEWEKFRGGPVKPSSSRMHATIGREGRIHLNSNLMKRLHNPEAVWLFFNRQTQQIAVQSTSLRMPEAFPVIKPKKQSTLYINAASFCGHFGIRIRQTHRFTGPHFSAEGKLILDLSKTVIVSRTRKRSATE